MQRDLTAGSVTGTMLRFAAPMIAGNLLQPLYNIADRRRLCPDRRDHGGAECRRLCPH